jgi:leucyl aminopeptidase
MEMTLQQGAIAAMPTEMVVVGAFQDEPLFAAPAAALDRAWGGALREFAASGDLCTKAEKVSTFPTRGALPTKHVAVVGLGERSKCTTETVRRAAAAVARVARRLRVTRYHVALDSFVGTLPLAVAAQAFVEGTLLGGYAFTLHKTTTAPSEPPLEALTLVLAETDAVAAAQGGATAGQIIAEAACLARDLVNQPGNYLTPTLLADEAQRVADRWGLACQVLGEGEMADLGMGALLGVAQGSEEAAKFIILEYNAARTDLPAYVLVGKGITFDSGGISIKPSEGMERMKDDMSGAAAVLATCQAVAALQLPLRVVGLLPATENLPDGRAYKPGDVVKAMSGLTVEIISTDAEGRLILADALAYAARYQPVAVVDLATLTGACVVALGHAISGLMGNSPELVAALERASATCGEKVWELPLPEEYNELIKSDVADVKNSGGRAGGTITGGLFLNKFALGYPWVHLDIAGTVWADAEKGYLSKGATGYGVRLLVQWLRDRV